MGKDGHFNLINGVSKNIMEKNSNLECILYIKITFIHQKTPLNE